MGFRSWHQKALTCSSLCSTMKYIERSCMDTKKPTSIRLSEDGKRIRKLLAKKLGLSESAIVELALRRLAEMERINSIVE